MQLRAVLAAVLVLSALVTPASAAAPGDLVSSREVAWHPEPLRLHVHGAVAGAEPEVLDVLLRLGDPEVRHDLLELVLAARVAERVRRRVGRVARLADDRRPAPAQEAAAVEVREGDVVVGRRRNGGVRVLLIPQALVAQILDGIRDEDRAVAEALSAARGRGLRASRRWKAD